MKRAFNTVIHLFLIVGICLSLFGDPVHLSDQNHNDCMICSSCLLADHSEPHSPCQHNDDAQECDKCKTTFSIRGHKLEDRNANKIESFSTEFCVVEFVDDENTIPLNPLFRYSPDIRPPLISNFLLNSNNLRAPPDSI